jgi:ribonuclease Z
MDTRACDAAIALAEGVDLLLCEATFLEGESFKAADYGHLTAREAGVIAREAGARLLVLTHFSSRYPTPDGHLREAREVFPDVVVAEDLDVIPFPTVTA